MSSNVVKIMDSPASSPVLSAGFSSPNNSERMRTLSSCTTTSNLSPAFLPEGVKLEIVGRDIEEIWQRFDVELEGSNMTLIEALTEGDLSKIYIVLLGRNEALSENEKSAYSETLVRAAEMEDLKLVQFLMKSKDEIDPDSHQYAMGIAARKGNMELMKLLLQKPIADASMRGWVLREAVSHGPKEMIAFLLSYWTYSKENLEFAISMANKRSPVLKDSLTLEFNLAIGGQKARGEYAIKAAQNGDIALLKTAKKFGALERDDHIYALGQAAKRNDIQIIRELLKQPFLYEMDRNWVVGQVPSGQHETLRLIQRAPISTL